MASLQHYFESANGRRTAYQLIGEGEPLLLLHGFGGAAIDWLPSLQEWGSGFQFILPDLHGHGHSSRLETQFRHDEAATDILALLNRLGCASCRAVGVSGGGNVLLYLAARQPSRIKSMVLVSATSHFPDTARAIMRQYGFDVLPKPEQDRMFERHPGGRDQIEEIMASARGFADSHDLHLTAEQLSKIKARTLLVQGDHDPFYPIEITYAMADAIPASELWIVEGGGHAPITGDRRSEFYRRAAEFLRR